MKLSPLLPPAVALVVVGAGLGLQLKSLATLDNANGLLRQRIAAASDSGPGTKTAHATSSPANGPVYWKTLARQLAEMRTCGGLGDTRPYIRFFHRSQGMTREELVAALDEIAVLELPATDRSTLERMLIEPLIRKDPELALTGYMDRAGMVSLLGSALREWAKKDVGMASAWFDQQIAAGKFDSKSLDGKSRSRMNLESILMSALLASDPAAVDRRLSALPDDQHADVVSNFGYNSVKEESQLAFAKLVRDQVPASQQASIISRQVSQLVTQGGYAKVTEYLARIDATPTERTACVEDAVSSKLYSDDKKVTRGDLDAMRTWVATQAPDTTDHVTGKILGAACEANQLDFAAAAEMAVQYNQACGNDEVLATFLEGAGAPSNKEQARELAARISDEKRRAEILKNLE